MHPLTSPYTLLHPRTPLTGERSFHVFYQLLSDHKLCAELNLLADAPPPPPPPPPVAIPELSAVMVPLGQVQRASPTAKSKSNRSKSRAAERKSLSGRVFLPNQHPALDFEYLRHSGRTAIPGVSDAEEWRATLDAQEQLGIGAEERRQVAELLAGLLRLGNVRFREAADADESHTEACELDGGESRAELAEVARLWQLHPLTLQQGLTERGMTTRRGSRYSIPLDTATSAFGRDALAKMVYERLFRWLLAVQNKRNAPAAVGRGLELLTMLHPLTMLHSLTMLQPLTMLHPLTMLQPLTMLHSLTMLQPLTALQPLPGGLRPVRPEQRAVRQVLP